MKLLFLVCATLVWHTAAHAQAQPKAARAVPSTFTNPLLSSGPDPWVIRHAGFYYYMNTTGRNLTIWKTLAIGELRTAEKKVIWTPPATGPYSGEVWAPELHFLEGRWYIYFAADDGRNETHRIWVLEGCSSDPLECAWTLKGKIADASDKWAIDPTVFRKGTTSYLIWAGWEGDKDGTENIYIAAMKNPWTLATKRVRISTPEFAWEKVGDRPGQNPSHVNVNEAPEVLEHGGKIFLTYSASGCWTDSYTLGMLSADSGSDPLKPSSWKKSPTPVFSESAGAHAYGPGHNSFFKSRDGREDWLIYHANPGPGEGCGDARSPRAQQIHWKPDGTPDFGRPVGLGIALPQS